MPETTEKTVASELREAAERLRSAGAAASKPPWRSEGQAIATGSGLAALAYNGVDAAWITLVGPLLAEPLASWLEKEAASAEHHVALWVATRAERPGQEARQPLAGLIRHHFGAPLAVARVLNGTTERSTS